MTTKNICQTIIDEETGEICGHTDYYHSQITRECRKGECIYSKSPCKKFKPQSQSQSQDMVLTEGKL